MTTQGERAKRKRRADWGGIAIVLLILLGGALIVPSSLYSRYVPVTVSGPVHGLHGTLRALLDSALMSVGTLRNFMIGSNMNESVSSVSTATNPSMNGGWATGFFALVNSNRGSTDQLTPCTSLSNLAKFRFGTMNTGKNWEVSHYGYQQDLTRYLGGLVIGSFGEEYFFPDGYSPDAFARNVNTTAPYHWQGLVDPQFHYYGYYFGNGPVIEYSGYACRAPTEIVGEGVNMTEVGAPNCNISVVHGTWFVIELGSVCP